MASTLVSAKPSASDLYEYVHADACEAMPEHFHGLIHLKPGNTKHLGQIIKGFMIGCSHAYWDTLGIPWRDMGYIKGVRTPEWQDRDHTLSHRGPALFVHGYNDVEALTDEQVEIKRAYIRDQARKRLIQGVRNDCFFKHRYQRSANGTNPLANRFMPLLRIVWFRFRAGVTNTVVTQQSLAKCVLL